MKFKRIFSLLIIALAIFGFSFIQKPLASADTTDVTIKKVSGYSYTVTYLVEDAGVDASGKTVKYKKATQADSEYAETGNTVEFSSVGSYVFGLFASASDATPQSTFNVEVVNYTDTDESSMSYTCDFGVEGGKIAAVNTAISEQVKDLTVGDSFSFTSSALTNALDDVIKSEFYPYSSLTKTYYYATPQSTSYTSTTSSKMTLSNAGTYSFYVIVKDEAGNVVSTEDLVEGKDGWYQKDSVTELATGDVIIPVFTFEVEKITAPVITVSTSESGFLNLEYNVKSFEIEADSYDTEYKLYFSSNNYDKDDEKYLTETAYIDEVVDNSVDVTDELFNQDTVSFTPDKKGYYYVLVRAVDSANMSEEAMSRAISVQKEYTTVKIETEFFKNNIVSVVCASIALACCVAIMILLFIKPKNKDDVILEVNKK